MLMEVKKHFYLLAKYFVFNLKCSMEYRVSFIVQVIGMIINNSSFLFFWWVIYRNVNTISGYTFSDILILWGLASATYGFNYILFGNVRDLTGIIINGGLDSYLLQPKDVVLNVCASRTEVSAWGDLLYGFILLTLSGRFSLGLLLLFTLFTIVGGMLFFATSLVINSLALYFGNIESTKRIFENFFITFATYPEGIFGKYMRMVFYTILPVGFIAYMPVGIMKSFSLIKTLMLLIVMVLYIIIAYWVFYNGLKRYESGNMLENKI
jgi:ABC-2 type transport system permease protein